MASLDLTLHSWLENAAIAALVCCLFYVVLWMALAVRIRVRRIRRIRATALPRLLPRSRPSDRGRAPPGGLHASSPRKPTSLTSRRFPLVRVRGLVPSPAVGLGPPCESRGEAPTDCPVVTSCDPPGTKVGRSSPHPSLRTRRSHNRARAHGKTI